MLPSFRGAAFRRIPKWDKAYAGQKQMWHQKCMEPTICLTFPVPKPDRPDYKDTTRMSVHAESWSVYAWFSLHAFVSRSYAGDTPLN